jgi:hypothetical protein
MIEIVHFNRLLFTDFEITIHNVIRSIFPDTSIQCCRFLLGQAWRLKIQKLGLSKEYKTGNVRLESGPHFLVEMYDFYHYTNYRPAQETWCMFLQTKNSTKQTLTADNGHA